jgi:hypothetical protein
MGGSIFLFFKVSRLALDPIQWVSGVTSPGVKQLEHEAEHSHPSTARAKKLWSFTSTPPSIFIAWCLMKQRENFTFYLTCEIRPNNGAPISCHSYLSLLSDQLMPRIFHTFCTGIAWSQNRIVPYLAHKYRNKYRDHYSISSSRSSAGFLWVPESNLGNVVNDKIWFTIWIF